jgi:hypothetical protein
VNVPKRILAPAATADAESQPEQDELRRLNAELKRQAADLQRLNDTLSKASSGYGSRWRWEALA